MEERFQQLKLPLDVPQFESEPATPEKVGLSNIVRRGFSLLFGWNRGKMRRIGASDTGRMLVSQDPVTSTGVPILADVGGRIWLVPACLYRDHVLTVSGVIAAPGAGAVHNFVAGQKMITFHSDGVWNGFFDTTGPIAPGTYYAGQFSGEMHIYGDIRSVQVTVAVGAVNYTLSSYVEPI